jgi:ABC-type polysaccharide/polyol phosphate export permease
MHLGKRRQAMTTSGPLASSMREVAAAVGLWRIWWRLGVQDLRLRFRRSVLGVGWLLVQLVVTMLAVGVVYGALLGQDLRTFLPYLTIGLVVWSFLTASIVEGGQALVGSEGYIKQIGLPIHVYILRCFVSASVSATISLVAYAIVAVVYRVPVQWGVLWVIPGLALLALVGLFLMAIFAHLNARFRDTAHLAGVAMQVLFYITPVLWPAEMLRTRQLGWIVDVNPLYHILEVIRQPLLSSRPASVENYAVGLLAAACLSAVASAVVAHYSRRVVYLL